MIAFAGRSCDANRSVDQVSRQAFGSPFDTVDRRCNTWIRQHI